ncbi:MAG: group I intron-associated PD-(D/E)XK endonuclease [bacterium]|nr:group I intron-associated PD-(D/E)XK endonuclease [bacterium]
MYKHHTKSKGDLGILKAKLDLFEQGYLILNPETEHAPFDIVAYKEGAFKRVQVKYRKLKKNDTVEITFRSSYAFSGGVVNKAIDKNEIDLYAIYCPETDQCYYIDPNHFSQSVSLRVGIPRNNQSNGVHWAEDFREVP